MNQSQHETKEEIKYTTSNHQPDTLGRQQERRMGEAEREPTECIRTEETTKGQNKQPNAQEKEENKRNNEKTIQEQHEPDELEQLLERFTDEAEAEKEAAEKEKTETARQTRATGNGEREKSTQ